ncbi:M23 family metallopeptidase [Nocardioides coralli]|uniref:M23 family metallopeptidase n=1 Tax=Nocardioides coralli TaxID=2872154 RepID=UPI001CA38B6D|nr:M23 family metallopeptidase [Nocardioides coralli]QZY28416.1 peptidoglycan DD-metalloendopeptidase family protein [Nocardioides coralli]
MRFFPRTARRRLLVAGVASSLALGALSIPLAFADDLRDKQRNVQSQIKKGERELEVSSSRLRDALDRLSAARADLTAARDHLERTKVRLAEAQERDREMREKLAQARARLAQAEADLARGKQDVASQRESVTDLVTTIYQEGDPELQAFSSMLSARSPAELTWTQEGQSVMLGRETRAYDQLRAAEVLLQVRQEQMEAAEAEVEKRRQEAADHLVLMRELTVEAREARARVREVVDEQRVATRAASRARAQDRADLAKLRAEEQRIRELIAQQARSGGYNGATGGFLNRPVPGIVTSGYGYRTHPIYGYYGLHNGTDFRAYCGTPMYASAGGTVLSTHYSSVYGNRLYLNVGTVNGKNVTVVYNHLSRYAVGRGARVARGQVVGYAGATGWSTACHLHFMVLVNGRPVDPMNWM